MDSAERIVETIQEIKQKIPSDPYEAELILMAEMVAEEDEEKNNKLETQKEKASGKETESKETPAPDELDQYHCMSNGPGTEPWDHPSACPQMDLTFPQQITSALTRY
ncbi:hypothetical protein GOODEAATRI_024820 [Goodea atripinnis]|uniref:Uncharacterized protein n=1 Tax=Goodea atripinnis TaxID=208336 RepID=A0ABV0P7K9_9TELE